MRKTCLAGVGIVLAGLAAALGGRAAGDEGAEASPLVIDAPGEGALLGQRKVRVTGHLTGVGTAGGVLTVNGAEAKIEGRKFEADVAAPGDGPFTIDAVYGEVGFPATRARRVVQIDATPPVIEIESPQQETIDVVGSVGSIRGWARDPHLFEVLWNGRATKPEPPGTTNWWFDVPFVLPKGQEVRVEIEAVDAAGNRSAKTVRVLRAVDPSVVTDVPDAGAVRVRIGEAGALAIADAQGSFQSLGNFGSPDPAEQDRALQALQKTLVARAQDRALREPDGSSRLVLDIQPDAGVRWRWVQWVIQVGADPQVKIYRLRFAPPDRKGEAIVQMLPKDRGIQSGAIDLVEPPALAVRLFRLNEDRPDETQTKIKIGGQEWLLPKGRGNPARSAVFGALQARIQGLREANPDLYGEIEAPPPKGPAVPYEDVWGVLQAFLAAGVTEVRFVGAAAPLPRSRAGSASPDLPVEESLDEDGLSDAPFEGPSGNGLIGIGGGAGGAFKSRGGHRNLRAGGGAGKKADDAVEHALRWLAAHQSADGGWEAGGWDAWCDGKPAGAHLVGRGKSPYDTGVTGLALLAFLGTGYTNRGDHPFAKVVSNGMRYLKNVQDAEGCFGPRTSGHYVYNHAIAALAMVEAYGMTGSAVYRGSAQKALDFVQVCRNPYFAWRYGVKPGDNDTSVTGWMTSVLHAAKLVNQADVKAGRPPSLAVDEDAFEGVRAWIDKMTDPDYGRVGYQSRGSGPARPTELIDKFPAEKSESMTAVAMLLRTFLGENPQAQPEIRKGADLCSKLLPTWNPNDGSIDMYYWFYGTLAMFQVGGEHWARWNDAMKTAIVDSQKLDGEYCSYKGSWDPIDPWGPDGGRVYSTAILALCLEVYYRYDKVFGR